MWAVPLLRQKNVTDSCSVQAECRILDSMNFGYPWWLSYGHLVILSAFGALFALAWVRRWPRWEKVLIGTAVAWAAVAFVIVRFVIDINGPGVLPTSAFLPSGHGRVLDLGAGTGRSSIMLLKARPDISLVALDLFGDSFNRHFGAASETPQARLISNLNQAGVGNRVQVVTADMRQIPFPDGTFDAVVSAYAIDHLPRTGIDQTLGETARVLKPGGEFLVLVIGKEPWLKFAFGPLLMHPGTRDEPWWLDRLRNHSFEVIENGTRPATLYLLARRVHSIAGPPVSQ